IALSSLFPPFEATAPTVLSQLFRTIEERYHGDALQCLLNFLIPAKHILESVQQAACAAYSDVLFRCEGWPLCLRDRVVIQLAPINPLLLRPGDFYLQVEPFGEQSARIVLKSLLVQEDLLGHENLVLQAGSRLLEGTAIEGTPIPETSYPCIFTESWLREINEGRHGNPLCQCVLSSDQGVVKVPWTEVANPEFHDRPKSNIWPETKPCSTPTLRVKDLKTEISKNESQVPIGLLTLDMETRILPANDGMAVSVQLVDGGSRLVKVDQGHPISSFAGKPVGWVSPNTWDSRHNRELEGEYVDLLEFSQEKETLVLNKIAMPTKPLGFKLVRTTQPAPKSNVNMCEEDCNPCMQNKPPESMQNDPESKCRYRQSYMAALRNPVNFERTSMLRSLDETRTDVGEVEPSCEGYRVGLRLKPLSCTFGQTPNQADRNPMQSFENSVQQKQSPKNSSQSIPHDCSSRENAESSDQHMTQQLLSMVQARQQHKSFLTGQQDLHQTVLGTKALPNKRQHCLNNSFRQDSFQMRTSGQKHAKAQHLPKMGLRALPDHSGHRQDANLCLQGFNPIQLTQASRQTPPLFEPQFSQILFQNENRPLDYKVFCDDRHSGRGSGSPVQVIKVKSRSKSRSSSSVSETTKECLQSHKPTNRSRSDVYPEIIPMLPAIQGIKHTANLVSPKLNRRQEARKEVYSSGKAGTPAVNGVELQKSDADQLLTGQPENGVQATLFSQDPTIKSLLQLGIICLPGGRDRAGRAVVEVYGGRKGWASSQLSPHEFCRLLLYLHSIPRMEVRELGLTVVIDSRKCPLPSVFYKSLLMVQEQALHAVHTILMLVDKDANPRPEKQPGLQIDVVTSLKALHKTVDGQQLTSDLGGSFPYSHEDWLQFHQKLSLFRLDLQAASSLLQTAIRRLDVKKTDTAKDVQSCIQEQRSSMKMVLEDTRLVALQREGGSILARMRKEESRFAQSEDFRDSLESVTCLYNQMEEAVHTLVMKSNQSLQHLEHVLRLREAEDSLSTIQKWCDAEEQSWQKDKDDTEKTLLKIEQRLQDVQSVLIRAKEKKEKGMLLIKEVERKSKGIYYPETKAFGCKATTFKTNVTGFLLKAEERKSELETSVDLYRFCEEASSLVKECMEYLEHIQSTNSPVCCCRREQGSLRDALCFCWSPDSKLQCIMEELLQTEREYVRALGYVVENYMLELERPDVPQDLRGHRGCIFGNLEKLRDFHQHHFLQELELCLKEPFCVGRCFLKHVSAPIQSCELQQKQQLLGDKMDLSSYLLKPVQRISKYGLLLQDMLRECETGAHAGHERLEIQTALNIIQFQLRHGNNLLAMDDLQDCDVNLKEQGQLVRRDEFLLTFRKKKCYRHIFLFQDLILFSKTRRTDVGNDTYIYKQSFKTSDIGMTHNFGDSGLCFEIWFRRRKSQDTYILQAPSREVKENWTRDLERILWEQAVLNREIRMQERVFMGIGHKPFMDIQPSEMAINDRAVNCSPTGRGGIPVLRLNSVGSASYTSSSGSHSSSSGWGSTSPVGHLINPSGGDVVRYIHGTSGILEEDDLDQESGNQSTLVESSVSSGESVSCFSSSGHSCSSVIGGDYEHTQSEAPVIGVKKACAHTHECSVKPTNPPGQTRDHMCTTVRHTDLSVLIVFMKFLHCALPFTTHSSYFIVIFQLC
uniref:Quattro n=1 Tax=Sinocyclocheilus rhinocerous TaxID=307959 RepID=A0A673NBV8_9TELE